MVFSPEIFPGVTRQPEFAEAFVDTETCLRVLKGLRGKDPVLLSLEASQQVESVHGTAVAQGLTRDQLLAAGIPSHGWFVYAALQTDLDGFMQIVHYSDEALSRACVIDNRDNGEKAFVDLYLTTDYKSHTFDYSFSVPDDLTSFESGSGADEHLPGGTGLLSYSSGTKPSTLPLSAMWQNLDRLPTSHPRVNISRITDSPEELVDILQAIGYAMGMSGSDVVNLGHMARNNLFNPRSTWLRRLLN